MCANTAHRTLSVFVAPACLAAIASVTFPAPALAITPVVQYVEQVSGFNSVSPKIAVAQCPAGMAVLGGTALLKGEEGQVAIQAAFPLWDAGLARYVFIVKATEDLSGTIGSWSVTAGAYCTNTTVPQIVTQSSLFDSDSIKSATVTCPENMRVVGMGAEASILADAGTNLAGATPPLGVVLRGFDVDDDLTTVTARATEVGAAIDDSWGGFWQITAVAACAFPLYFDGLQRVTAKTRGGGLLEGDIESRVDVSCPKGKRVIAAGSQNNEHDMGQWYLDRFSRYNLVTQRIVGEAFRNAELGTVLTTQFLYAICTDK
jgi:hypothetical protein